MQTYLIGIKWAVLFSICYTGPVNKINTSTFFFRVRFNLREKRTPPIKREMVKNNTQG